ncbi:MAG TPA: transaldolase [Kofleriaceae bacterium]|jgi:transaldolase|nr:transaldolase [Kofleriaceae bacterium]
MTPNPLHALTELGQSVWIDHLARDAIVSGQLRRRIAEDDLRGVTSNPTIFDKAISGHPSYEAPIRTLAQRGKSPAEIFEAIAVEDVQLAADELRAVFDRLDGRDGFVSLEVSPRLAYETAGTIDEARRLWRAVDRPNVMIKVPATEPGLTAIEALIAEGISINITLLFGLDRYERVASAYLAGLETRARQRLPVRVPSVASFFLSRIDTAIDPELDRRARDGRIAADLASRLRGQSAIASARLAYQRYQRIVADARFTALEARGARPQRLLWASTSTKDPAYSDTYYVDALIGHATIDTMTPETFDAYRAHGQPVARLEQQVDQARAVLDGLATAGIDLDAVTRRLEQEGVDKFAASYDRLLATIARRRDTVLGQRPAS